MARIDFRHGSRRSGQSGQSGRRARRDGAPADDARQRHLHRGAGHRLRLRRLPLDRSAQPTAAAGAAPRGRGRFDGHRHLARFSPAGAAIRHRPGRCRPLHPLACRSRLRPRRSPDLQLPPARLDSLLRLRRDHEPDATDLHLRLRRGPGRRRQAAARASRRARAIRTSGRARRADSGRLTARWRSSVSGWVASPA